MRKEVGKTRFRVGPRIEPLECRAFFSAMTIAQENQLPGTPESQWRVQGSGDPTLQGFSTDMSVNQGQSISFKINDTANVPYHLDILRMGYYGGNGARLVSTIQSSQTVDQVQPAPLTDPTRGLIDCGNWAASASWNVPADATSGIYFARAVRDDTGGASMIFFVVRNDSGHSNLLFQTSDATWQAYNDYGGRSLYVGPFPHAAVSYNRPLTGGFGSYYYPLLFEYPMVRWLESNGYDVSYFTGVDSDRYGSLIKDHNVFLSVGHDEYWSGGQRANVQAARDAGVNLAFFSGNTCWWKTHWDKSIAADATPYRTLVCFKESHPLPPSAGEGQTWTGTWRDARFSPPLDGGQPENGLIGTASAVGSHRNDVMTLSYPFSRLRFWRNTRIAALASGQTFNFPSGILGYEWDSDLDNGFRPPGLFDLSATTLSVGSKLLDDYWFYGPGTATHNLTMYRAPSGARVFSAGTVQWSWGLDNHHLQAVSAISPDICQATVNVLADMGVQPATLQSGLVSAIASTDILPPISVIIPPAPGQIATAREPFTIKGTAQDLGGGVVAGVEVSTDGGATWHPAAGTDSWSYTFYPAGPGTLVIRSRAVDDSGNLEAPSVGLALLVAPAPPILPDTAVLLKTDASTAGTWIGKYGADGYLLADGESRLPAYAQVFFTAAHPYTWNIAATALSAMQNALGTARVGAVWYAVDKDSIEINLTDGKPHQVGIYVLDWDKSGPVQSVAAFDAVSGLALDSPQTMQDLTGGRYLVYEMTGDVRLTFTSLGGAYAVFSGIFFGPPPLVNLTARLLPGDASLDGKVAFNDLVILAQNFGSSSATWSTGDFNGDGTVGFDDLVLLSQNYGRGAGAVAAVASVHPAIASRASVRLIGSRERPRGINAVAIAWKMAKMSIATKTHNNPRAIIC